MLAELRLQCQLQALEVTSVVLQQLILQSSWAVQPGTSAPLSRFGSNGRTSALQGRQTCTLLQVLLVTLLRVLRQHCCVHVALFGKRIYLTLENFGPFRFNRSLPRHDGSTTCGCGPPETEKRFADRNLNGMHDWTLSACSEIYRDPTACHNLQHSATLSSCNLG